MMKKWPQLKCGRESIFVDDMDVQKEIRARTSNAITPRLDRLRISFDMRISVPKFPSLQKSTQRTALYTLEDHDDSDSSDSVEIKDSNFGSDEHRFKSSAPRPIGSALSRDITNDLFRYRCGSSLSRRSSRAQAQVNVSSPSSASETSQTADSPVLAVKRQGHKDKRVRYEKFSAEEAAEIDSVEKISMADEKLISLTFRKFYFCWHSMYMEHMTLKQQILDQYSGCCAFLKRSPFLQAHIRRFLLKPSCCHLDLAGCGISSKDLMALICSLAGRGCNMKSDRVKSIQEIRVGLGDSCLSSIDLSSNNMCGDGVKALVSTLIKVDFLRVSSPLPSDLSSNISSALTELNIARNALGISGSSPIESMLASENCTLRKLLLCSNMLADIGCAAILRALWTNTSLNVLHLSENGAANSSGAALGAMLERNSTLRDLNVAYNHLRGLGAKRIGVGLGRNKTLMKLDVQWNGFGDEDTVAELAKSLNRCHVQEMNLAHNRIKLKGASILALCLETGTTIRELVLDGNLLGQIGARLLHRSVQQAAKLGQEFLTALHTANCGTHIIDRGAFDPCEAAGHYELDMRDPYDRSVLANLIRIHMRGSGSFVAVKVQGKATAMNATLDGLGARICDNSSIDMDDWAIQTVTGVSLPVSERAGPDGQPIPLARTWAKLLHRPEESMSCLLRLTFKNDRKRATVKDCLSDADFGLLRETFADSSVSSEKCVETIDTVLGSDNFLSMDQMEKLLLLLSDASDAVRSTQLSHARVVFVSRCFHKIVGSDRNMELLSRIANVEERLALEKALGAISFEFSPNNPTGFYKLDLGEPAQREIVNRLIEIRNEMIPREEQLLEFYGSGKRAGGLREDAEDDADLERVWRNSKLDGAPFVYEDGWKVPYSGMLEVDFVDITKPSYEKMPPTRHDISSDQLFNNILTSLDECGRDERRKVLALRRASNSFFFTCEQLAIVLDRFTEPETRVEACVVGFARTLDWYGFKHLVFRLKLREQKLLRHRLGYINLFLDVVAVDYYELDLSRAGDRFIMQELLHLASVEPGDNMLDGTYQGIDFTVPAGWLKEVPRTGVMSFCYCREQRVIEKVFQTGSWDSAGSPYFTREDGRPFEPFAYSRFVPKWLMAFCEKNPQAGPAPSIQPHDGAWVRPRKVRHIKMKMMEKFMDPEKMFNAMDRDGGGSLDRKELSMGLFALGIWLCPSELQVLLETLDEDGGGDIDFAEFEKFWNVYTFD